MRTVWMLLMLASASLLVLVLLKNKLSLRWIKPFCLHLVAASAVLYTLNYSGIVTGYEVPLNPATIGTVVLLGLPGIMLVLGLRWTLS